MGGTHVQPVKLSVVLRGVLGTRSVPARVWPSDRPHTEVVLESRGILAVTRGPLNASVSLLSLVEHVEGRGRGLVYPGRC